MTGRAVTSFVVDWDGDGDLDILSGDIDGSVHLLRNESGGKALTFGEKEKIQAGGKPIAAPGRNSGPLVADWDGDGKHDLLLGCGDGSVRFYRNVAEKGEPVFRGHEQLVPASTNYPGSGRAATSPSGSRAKLAVFDWNGDGALDLLLGDFTSKPPPPKTLTDEQKRQKADLEAKQRAVRQRMVPHYVRFQAAARKEAGLPDDVNFRTLPAEQSKKYSDAYQRIMAASEEFQALQKEYRALWGELSKYRGRPTTAGHVWLFLRKT